jgi:hypothetical protein
VASIGTFRATKRQKAIAEQSKQPDTFDFVDHRDTVHTFTLIDGTPSAFPLMELADAIQNGVDEVAIEAMAAMFGMLKACIVSEDWGRFRKVCHDSKADWDDVWPIAQGVYELVTGRPTRGSSESSDGPPPTGSTSTDESPTVTDPPSVDLSAKVPANEWQPAVAKRAPRKTAAKRAAPRR